MSFWIRNLRAAVRAVGYQPSAISYQLSRIGCWLLASGFWLSASLRPPSSVFRPPSSVLRLVLPSRRLAVSRRHRPLRWSDCSHRSGPSFQQYHLNCQIPETHERKRGLQDSLRATRSPSPCGRERDRGWGAVKTGAQHRQAAEEYSSARSAARGLRREGRSQEPQRLCHIPSQTPTPCRTSPSPA
jgi:hypothetical protein